MKLSEDLLKHIEDKKGVVLVAGRPGMGKTTFVIELVNELTSGKMNEVAAMLLWYANYYGQTSYYAYEIDDGKKNCYHSVSIWQNIAQIYPQIEIVYDDCIPGFRPGFDRIVRYLAVYKKTKYILIDGLRGVPSEMDRSGRYWEDERYLSSCLDYLQKLAKYFNVVFIVEHSPNRSLEKRKNKRPIITDLMLDPDLLSKVNSIIMLYRDSYYGISHGNDNNKLDLEIQVIKTGKIELDLINPKVQEC